MSHYQNNVSLVGYVGQVKFFTSEGKQPFAKLSFATSKRFQDQQGQWVEHTSWHTLHCFGKLAEFIQGKVEKGSYLSVSGELEYQSWESKTGEKHTSAVIRVHHLHRLIDKKLQARLDGKETPSTHEASPQAVPMPDDFDIPY